MCVSAPRAIKNYSREMKCLCKHKYLEDYVVVQSEIAGQAFTAMFDGQEVAKYTRDNLWEAIKKSNGFDSKDLTDMVQVIKAGFLKTNEDMWKVRGKPFLLYTPHVLKGRIQHTSNKLWSNLVPRVLFYFNILVSGLGTKLALERKV